MADESNALLRSRVIGWFLNEAGIDKAPVECVDELRTIVSNLGDSTGLLTHAARELAATLHVVMAFKPSTVASVLDVLVSMCGGAATPPLLAPTAALPETTAVVAPAVSSASVFFGDGTPQDDEEATKAVPVEVAEVVEKTVAAEVEEKEEEEDTSAVVRWSDFCHCTLLSFLQGMNHRGLDQRNEILDRLVQSCGVPEKWKGEVFQRWKVRRNQLLCKALMVKSSAQVPNATFLVVELLEAFITAPAVAGEPLGGDEDASWVQSMRKRLLELLSESHMHHQLFACVIVRTVLSYHAHCRRLSTSAAGHSAVHINANRQLADLFDATTVAFLGKTFLELIPAMFCDGDEQDTNHAKHIACILYSHGLLSIRSAVSVYFGALMFTAKPVVSMDQRKVAQLETVMDLAKKFEADLVAHITSLKSEAAIDLAISTAASSRGGTNSSSSKRNTSSGVPLNGECKQQMFYRMVSVAPAPTWQTTFSKAELKSLPWKTSLLTMCSDLLSLQLYRTLAAFIVAVGDEFHVDVFSYFGDAIDQPLALIIQDHVKELLGKVSGASSLSSCLTDLFPLLKVAQTRVATVGFLFTLLQALLDVIEEAPAAEGTSSTTILIQNYLVFVVIPCLRTLPAAPTIYAQIDRLFTYLGDTLLTAAMLMEAAQVPRLPHDLYIFKQQDATFSFQLRRMTLKNVLQYLVPCRRMLYSNPLVVCEKLFQQAIGYDNANMMTHAQLLAGAPQPILRIFTILGFSHMKRYAAEEREGAENRVAIIAALICAVWRCNVHSFDGGFALRFVERTYHRAARENIVFGNEFLKAAMLHLTGIICEYEEQYNAQQLAALGAFGHCAKWFGRGTAASYLSSRWHPQFFNPGQLHRSREAFQRALNSPLAVEGGDNRRDASQETKTTPSVGTAILTHLAALDAKVYDILSDLSGTVEHILNESAKHHNTMNDLLWLLQPLVKHSITEAEASLFALPPVVAKLCLPSLDAAEDPDLVSCDTVQEKVAAAVASLRSYHMHLDDAVYEHAKKEATALLSRLEQEAGSSRSVRTALASSFDWVRDQIQLIGKEHDTHKMLSVKYLPIVDGFIGTHILPWIRVDPLSFVRVCVIPRCLLSLDDVVTMSALLRRIAQLATSNAAAAGGGTPSVNTTADQRRVADMLLCIVTAIMTFFASFTDGECKRCGTLLANVLALLDTFYRSDATSKMLPTSSDATAPSTVDHIPVEQLCAQRIRSSVSKRQAETRDLGTPAYILEVDAYLAQAFHQILTAEAQDAPQFLVRNAFIVLERIKMFFPNSPEAATVMKAAVFQHSDKRSAYFAAATAQLKHYSQVMVHNKGKLSSTHMSQLLSYLTAQASVVAAAAAASTAAAVNEEEENEEDTAAVQEEEAVVDDEESKVARDDGGDEGEDSAAAHEVTSNKSDGGSDKGSATNSDDDSDDDRSSVSSGDSTESHGQEENEVHDQDDASRRGCKRPRDDESTVDQ